MSKHAFGSIDEAKVEAKISNNADVWACEYFITPKSTNITCRVMDPRFILARVDIGDTVSLEELDVTFNNGEMLYWINKPEQLSEHRRA
jgi:hypothetical protein